MEFHSGVGLRTLTTFIVGFMPLLVFIASFHNPAAVWKIRRLDYVCGAMSLAGTAAWLATQNGVVAIVAAIAADFLAGVPTMIKSWSHPESESVSSYIGAVVNSGILLLTIDHWTTEVAAFPLFILCVGSVQVLLVGGRAGPRLRHAPCAPPCAAARSPRQPCEPDRRRGGRPGRKFAREVTTTKEASVPTAHVNGIDIEYLTSGIRRIPRSFSSWDWAPS